MHRLLLLLMPSSFLAIQGPQSVRHPGVPSAAETIVVDPMCGCSERPLWHVRSADTQAVGSDAELSVSLSLVGSALSCSASATIVSFVYSVEVLQLLHCKWLPHTHNFIINHHTVSLGPGIAVRW